MKATAMQANVLEILGSGYKLVNRTEADPNRWYFLDENHWPGFIPTPSETPAELVERGWIQEAKQYQRVGEKVYDITEAGMAALQAFRAG